MLDRPLPVLHEEQLAPALGPSFLESPPQEMTAQELLYKGLKEALRGQLAF